MNTIKKEPIIIASAKENLLAVALGNFFFKYYNQISKIYLYLQLF